MKTFKSPYDLYQLSYDHPAFQPIAKLSDQIFSSYLREGHIHDPDSSGYIILLEQGDDLLARVWQDSTLLELFWEDIYLEAEHFHCIFLANDEFGIVFVLPDAPWMPAPIRTFLESHL